jgi:hypothetical protein
MTYTFLLFRAFQDELPDIHASPATYPFRIFETSRHIITNQEATDARRDDTDCRSATFRSAILEQ